MKIQINRFQRIHVQTDIDSCNSVGLWVYLMNDCNGIIINLQTPRCQKKGEITEIQKKLHFGCFFIDAFQTNKVEILLSFNSIKQDVFFVTYVNPGCKILVKSFFAQDMITRNLFLKVNKNVSFSTFWFCFIDIFIYSIILGIEAKNQILTLEKVCILQTTLNMCCFNELLIWICNLIII